MYNKDKVYNYTGQPQTTEAVYTCSTNRRRGLFEADILQRN